MRPRALLVAVLLLAWAAGPAQAQQPVPPAWRPLRIAKWSAVTASAAAALFGFSNNRRADELFGQIEQVCVDHPDRCARLTGGAYADAALEQDYQRVRALDRRTSTALVASQVGIAASVVLFILDLRNQRPPDNVPYQPRRLRIAPGVAEPLEIRITLPLGTHR